MAGTSLSFSPQTAGFAVDAQASAARALSVGRSGGVLSRGVAFFARMARPESVSLELKFDPKRLAELEDEWQANAIKDPPFSGGLSIDGTIVTPLYPRAGSRLDRARVLAQLREAVVAVASPAVGTA